MNEIVKRIVAGEKEAFKEIIKEYELHVYRVIYSILKHPKNTEDMMQEVFVKIYVSLPRYDGRGFKTWITRIAVNQAIDFKRQEQRMKEKLTQSIDQESFEQKATLSSQTIEDEILKRENRDYLRDYLNKVPKNYKDILVAYYIEEKSYQEIANEQNMRIKNVEVKLYRAKQWVRKRWKKEEFL